MFNALYKDDTVYIPIECRQCRGKTAVIGVQVLKQATKQVMQRLDIPMFFLENCRRSPYIRH